ncbi:GLPGLI family protein [Riemerella anatipestifer]|uniref:GLPGLI family protein n=1 Tax=Riemerella anatipestifer TaxID=34085 RepID=UPI00129D5B97|nr:GLPGLI family protein [Riemerella anatipestifer]MRM83997.1 GLPGLI family protein [Riemerella anatipestifer]
MKRIFLIIFSLILCDLYFSQDYKIIYEFKWKSDKSDSNYNLELMALTTNSKLSQFEALYKFKYDSLKTDLRNKDIRSVPSPRHEWKFQQLIEKDLQSGNILVEQDIFDKTYITKYTCKPEWKILKDKREVFGYNSRSAETNFGGRKWIAWFTDEIPINDGPYKFYGLPGLILRISDSEENFIFEAKALTREKSDISKRNRESAIVKLTPKQWESFWEKFQKDPSNIFANLNEQGATYSYVYNGKDVNTKEARESFNKVEKEKINFFKNPIDLKNCE